jgi:hypothetical protein
LIYGHFDGLIGAAAPALGPDGLNRLKAKFEELTANPPKDAAGSQRRVIGLSTRGPIYQDDYERGRHARLVRTALTEIATVLAGAAGGFSGGGHWPEWQRGFDAGNLRVYLKRLPSPKLRPLRRERS